MANGGSHQRGEEGICIASKQGNNVVLNYCSLIFVLENKHSNASCTFIMYLVDIRMPA